MEIDTSDPRPVVWRIVVNQLHEDRQKDIAWFKQARAIRDLEIKELRRMLIGTNLQLAYMSRIITVVSKTDDDKTFNPHFEAGYGNPGGV